VWLLCLTLLLLSTFWALGLLAAPPHSDLALRVPYRYLLFRNAIWSTGALVLAVLLFAHKPIAQQAATIFPLLWLIWRFVDTFLLQSVPTAWPDVILPLLGFGAFLAVLASPSMQCFLQRE